MDEACSMRMDTITRGFNCFELKRSATSLLHANGHRYAWFALLRAELKWNKLVACEWTLLRVRHNVLIRTNLSHANGHGFVSFALFAAETNWNKLVA